jgi:hypothetical protein
MISRKKKSIEEYQKRFEKLIEPRLKSILDKEGVTGIDRAQYRNFVESACKELKQRSKEEEAKIITELVEKWTKKGLKKEILEEIAKLLPYWYKALYPKQLYIE